jgi:hypothetical protein
MLNIMSQCGNCEQLLHVKDLETTNLQQFTIKWKENSLQQIIATAVYTDTNGVQIPSRLLISVMT